MQQIDGDSYLRHKEFSNAGFDSSATYLDESLKNRIVKNRIVTNRLITNRIAANRKDISEELFATKKRIKPKKKLTIVIPALNEEDGIGKVIDEIPIPELRDMGYAVEIMVIDNGSKDRTSYIAKNRGAKVIIQPIKGYGNAYKAGFANASGDIIATGDADLTYPFKEIPKIIKKIEEEDLDFVTTNRLDSLQPGAMSRSHYIGNLVFNNVNKLLFNFPYKDTQSGMWVFKRNIWPKLNVRSSGMAFSEELKIEAFRNGFKCCEVPIEYRARVGEVKLNTIRDGIINLLFLIYKRIH